MVIAVEDKALGWLKEWVRCG